MRFWRWLMMAGLATTAARADYVEDLARIHLEAMGGKVRVMQLKNLRATGHLIAGEHELRFELIAERPNRLRVMTVGEGRTLIQGWDGSSAPWRLEEGKSSVARAMSVEDAADFLADAEFDDQLIGAAERGYQLDFAGEGTIGDLRVFKILVTHHKQSPFFLLLDAVRYFIVARTVTHKTPSGREVTVETRYADFREVEGVFLPYRISVFNDQRLLNVTVIESVDANSTLPPDTFQMPKPDQRTKEG